jgi:hypothetical protein
MTLSSIRDSLVWAPDWLWGMAVLLIAAICALIAHRLIFMAFDRAFRARHPFLHTLAWQAKGLLALALVVVALAAVLPSRGLATRSALQSTAFAHPRLTRSCNSTWY